jgi:hypothetical protein
MTNSVRCLWRSDSRSERPQSRGAVSARWQMRPEHTLTSKPSDVWTNGAVPRDKAFQNILWDEEAHKW